MSIAPNYSSHLREMVQFSPEWLERLVALALAEHMNNRPGSHESISHYLSTGGALEAAQKVVEAMQAHGVDLYRL